MIRAFLFVGAGGFAGSIARYLFSMLAEKRFPEFYPWWTFGVNVIGCFVIGLLASWGEKNAWLQRSGWLLLATGFCGGFTTFSAFALENNRLLGQQAFVMSTIYTCCSVVFGIAACRAGILIAR